MTDSNANNETHQKNEDEKSARGQEPVKQDQDPTKQNIAEETAGSEGSPRQEQDMQMPPLPSDVYILSGFFNSLLINAAWQHLGLMADPGTGEMKKDLDQAKMAIDTIAFLFERMEGKMEANDANQMRNVLINLQMNFVAKNKTSE